MENTELRMFNSASNKAEHERPPEKGMQVDFSVIRSTEDSTAESIDTEKSSLLSTFLSNYECWNDETKALSTNNYDNANYRKIVELGESIVPDIYKIISKEPSPLVHALDEILPGYVKYDGYVSLQEACKAWTTILPILGKV